MELRVERLRSDAPDEAGEPMPDLCKRLPEVRTADLLLDVDKSMGFTDAFTCPRTGAPCNDIIGLLDVILAVGLNLGLSKMATASNARDFFDFFRLSRLSRWRAQSGAVSPGNGDQGVCQAAHGAALGTGVDRLERRKVLPATHRGEAMILINAKCQSEPGLKSRTRVSDQFGPFASQLIPHAVSEAPCMLDGLAMIRAG